MKNLTLLFLFSFCCPGNIFGKYIEVCSTCQLSSIQSALEISEDGDSIFVKSGIYKEGPMIIQQAVVLQGGEGAIIHSKEGEELITVESNDVTIRGLIFRGVKLSYLNELSAVRVKKSKRFTIENNRFINNFFSVYLEHAKDGVVRNNYIEADAVEEMSSGNGIHAWYCDDLVIENNEVIGHRDGIYFEFVKNSFIRNNLSKDNLRYGLHFMFSDNDGYSNNTFQNNGAGVAVMFSKFIEMQGNRFIQNWGTNSYGLLLKEISDANILNNFFEENTTGIFIEGSNRINYLKNEFRGNGWAVKIAGGCLDNVFQYNNFYQNTFEFSVAVTFRANTIKQNFWSDYSGYDLDRDGIGDVPHRPIKLFSFVTQQCPESIVLLRSLFIDLMNFSEKISPIFTPVAVLDDEPLMFPYEFEN